ncbi:MAG: hypothetical protein ABI478_01425 [Propionivibrio sp.]
MVGLVDLSDLAAEANGVAKIVLEIRNQEWNFKNHFPESQYLDFPYCAGCLGSLSQTYEVVMLQEMEKCFTTKTPRTQSFTKKNKMLTWCTLGDLGDLVVRTFSMTNYYVFRDDPTNASHCELLIKSSCRRLRRLCTKERRAG